MIWNISLSRPLAFSLIILSLCSFILNKTNIYEDCCFLWWLNQIGACIFIWHPQSHSACSKVFTLWPFVKHAPYCSTLGLLHSPRQEQKQETSADATHSLKTGVPESLRPLNAARALRFAAHLFTLPRCLSRMYRATKITRTQTLEHFLEVFKAWCMSL